MDKLRAMATFVRIVDGEHLALDIAAARATGNLREQLERPLARAEVGDVQAEVGIETVANTPEQAAAFQKSEFARWKTVIETGKITAD